MKQTDNYGLVLFDKEDTFSITAEENSLNNNMEIIDNALKQKASTIEIPTNVSELTNDAGYLTSIPSEYVTETELDKKGYLTEHQDLSDYALKSDIPSADGLATEDYVDGEIEKITAESIGALPDTTVIPTIPTNVSYFTNDAGYLTEHQSLDGYAKTTDLGALATKDGLTAAEVGALSKDTKIPNSLSDLTEDNNHRVVTDAEKIVWNAKSDFSGSYNDLTDKPTIPSVEGFITDNDVSNKISTHNTATDSHNDIRLLVEGLTTRLNTLADSDDTTLDQMSEVVAYIKSNKSLIEQITTDKVNVSDIINNLTTNASNKPLSAAQGVALKSLIDAITVPTKMSQLENDSKYLTSYTETDPTVPAWAKAATKPSYTKSEVGLGNVDNVKQYSDSNPPPYPVTSVNGKTGVITLSASDVSARPSTWLPTYSDVGADKSGTANSLITTHNSNASAHADIRELINQLSSQIPVKEDIVQQVLTELGAIPVYGRIDANNHIYLTSKIANGTYELYYEDENGNTTYICEYEHEYIPESDEPDVPTPTYTNILTSAINSDKTDFVGTNGEDGYKTGYRLNSSGAETAVDNWEVTGFIPITTDDTLYFKNVQFRGNNQKHDYIGLYNSSFSTLVSSQVISVFIEQTLENNSSAPSDYGITLDADNNIVSIDFKKLSTTAYGSMSVSGWQNVKYIRFSCFGITADSIITKNEPID